MDNEAIFGKFGINKPVLLGKGGEGEVFEIDADRVLKIYKKTDMENLRGLE